MNSEMRDELVYQSSPLNTDYPSSVNEYKGNNNMRQTDQHAGNIVGKIAKKNNNYYFNLLLHTKNMSII